MIWIVLILCLLALLIRAYRNTFHPTVTNVSIPVKSAGIANIRILHLSDLHVENLSVSPERVVAECAGQTLDLIVITGDLLDREHNIPRAVQFIETIRQLQPTLGTYVVFGNHDYVLPPMKLGLLKAELQRIGCHVLQNESHSLEVDGVELHIIGIDDYHTRKSDLKKAFRHVPAEGLRLVLTHDPNVVLQMKEYSFDYLLSGHFHGGQIHWPKPFHLKSMGELPRMNVVKGLHYHCDRPFYISEGLGQTGLNIRLRSRPEITLHTLNGEAVALDA